MKDTIASFNKFLCSYKSVQLVFLLVLTAFLVSCNPQGNESKLDPAFRPGINPTPTPSPGTGTPSTGPDVPEIVLHSPASPNNSDATPMFTVSLEQDGNFAASDEITIHNNNTCTSLVSGTVTGEIGANVNIEITTAQTVNTTVNYYAKIENAVGNSTCSEAHGTAGNGTEYATYVYTTAGPDVPEIVLHSPASPNNSDATPMFTVSFEQDGNFAASDEITIHNNNTCTSLVSGTVTGETGASVDIEITTSQTANTSVNYYARVEDAAGNSSCSEAHGTNGNGTEYATYIYDTAAPDVPEIVLQSPATSPGNDSTPTFRVSFENDSNFSATDTITIHAGINCTGAALSASVTNESGASVDIEITNAQTNGTSLNYYAKVTDTAGNASCSLAHTVDGNGTRYATYAYDGTPPDVPEIMIAIPGTSPSTDATPTFTVSLELNGNFIATDEITIHNNNTCTSAVSATVTAQTGASVNIEVTTSQTANTSVNYYARVEDAAGNSSCSVDHGTTGNSTEYATYVYDTIPPDVPEIVLHTPASSPGIDSTPQFTVSLELDGNFEATDKISIHNNDECTNLVSAESTGNTGASVNIEITSAATLDLSVNYYAKVQDAAGNSSCSITHGTQGDGTSFAEYTYSCDITITSNTTASDGDTHCSVTINSGVTYTIPSSANVTIDDVIINSGGTMILNREETFENVTVNGTLTADGFDNLYTGTSWNNTPAIGNGKLVFTVTDTLSVGASGAVHMDAKGYAGGTTGKGQGGSVAGPGDNTADSNGGGAGSECEANSCDGGGGSYSSLGAQPLPGLIYGASDFETELYLGSGGGRGGYAQYLRNGGTGGGAIKITADNLSTVSGSRISATGSAGASGGRGTSGGGSGGTIVLEVITSASFNGTISVEGGRGAGIAGGYGRMSIPKSLLIDGSNITLANMKGLRLELAATDSINILTISDNSVVFFDAIPGASVSTLEIDGTNAELFLDTDFIFGDIAVTRGLLTARAFDNLDIDSDGIWDNSPSVGNGKLSFAATNSLTVGANGLISMNGKGFWGGDFSTVGQGGSPVGRGDDTVGINNGGGGGFGGTCNGCNGSGASYGTLGGGGTPGTLYGASDFETELYLGSGGGRGSYSSWVVRGGSGGGAIKIVSPTILIAGNITSTGNSSSNGGRGSGGAGSGGTIVINASTSLSNSGTISVAGGAGTGFAGGLGRMLIDTPSCTGDCPPVAPTTLALQTPASSPSNETTPTIRVSGGGVADTLTVTLYSDSACTTSVGSAVAGAGSYADITLSALTDGTYTFYSKVANAFADSVCSTANVTYVLETSPPDVPEIMIAIPGTSPSTDATPTFTVSLELNGNFIATDEITIHNNNTCTSAVSATVTAETGASVNIEITTSQTANTSVNYYARVEDAAGNSSCSVDHGTVGNGTSYATHVYDATAPTAPEIVLKVASTPTPSQDDQPVFTITLDDDDTFETHGVTQITLHEGADCSGATVGTVNSPSGASAEITRNASAAEQSTVYRVKVRDAAGNTTCSTEHSSGGDHEGEEFATHLYDNTAPTWADSLSLGAATSNSSSTTPAITYTRNASDGVNGSGIDEYQYKIVEKDAGTCATSTVVEDWTTAPASGATVGSLSLSLGVHCLMMRAVDNVGLVSSSVEEEWEVLSDLLVTARYANAPNWMDYIRTADDTTVCDATETARSDCRHGGEYVKVDYANASDCTGLAMTDNLAAFDWTCNDNGADVTFYGILKSTKTLRDLINFDNDVNPSFEDNFVTLTGCGVDCPKSSSAAEWWTNTVTPLPNNSGGSILTLDGTDNDGAGPDEVFASGTLLTLFNSRTTPGYTIQASKLGIVLHPGATITHTGTESNCGGSVTVCVAGVTHFQYVEGTFNGDSTGLYGVYVGSNNKFQRYGHVSVANYTGYGIYFYDGDFCQATSITANLNGTSGIYLRSSNTGCHLGDVTSNSNGTTTSHHGIYSTGSAAEFSSITSNNNAGSGVSFGGTSLTIDEALNVNENAGSDGASFTTSQVNIGSITANDNLSTGVTFGATVAGGTIGDITVTGDVGGILTCKVRGVSIQGSSLNFGDIDVSECGDAATDTGIYMRGTAANNSFGELTISNQTGTALSITASGSSHSVDGVTINSSSHYGFNLQSSGNAFGPIYVDRSTNNSIRVIGSSNTFDNIFISNSGSGSYISGNDNTFNNIFNINNSGVYPIYFAGATGNRLGYLIIANNHYGGSGVYFGSSSNYNRVKGVLILNSANDGLGINGSTHNIIGPSTVANSGVVGFESYGLNTILHSPLFINSGTFGLYSHNTAASAQTIVNLASSNSGTHGIGVSATGNVLTRGALLISSSGGDACNVTAGGKGLVHSTCTTAGTDGSDIYGTSMSDALLRFPASLASSLIGKVSSDSQNTSHTSGTATYSASLDWFNFDHIFRGWGAYDAAAWPTADHRGSCTTAETCQIWDMALSSVDTKLLNRSGDGSTLNGDDNLNGVCEGGEICDVTEPMGDGSGNDNGVCEAGEICYNTFDFNGSCPVEVRGSRYTYSEVYAYNASYSAGLNGVEVEEVIGDGIGNDDGVCDTHEDCVETGNACTVTSTDGCMQKFLLNAMEIEDTGGDNDYLCEQGETCLYLPNFGIYQGHGTIGECIYSADGGLTGITMKGYLYNGR